MNLVTDKTLHPHLRDEEALVLENAVRLAIDSIINVIYGVNSARTHEYQRMVADRDKEIQRLEGRLGDMGRELQGLQRRACTCGLVEYRENSVCQSQTPADTQRGDMRGFGQSCSNAEQTAGRQLCDMSVSVGLYAKPTHLPSQSLESAPLSPPSRVCLEQTFTSSHSSGSSGLSEPVRSVHRPTSPSSLVVKEEPCDMDAVLIEWEMSEERFREHQESTGQRQCQERDGPTAKNKPTEHSEDGQRRQLMENAYADPARQCVTDRGHLRSKKKSADEAQSLKRAAWRAASKRYYARKVARQQKRPFSHVAHSHFPQPISFQDNTGRTMISRLPEDAVM